MPRSTPKPASRARAARPTALLSALAAAALLAGCGEFDGPGEALRLYGGLEPAYVEEAYEDVLLAVGGLRPYSFELVEGRLPPGLELSGGRLHGVPSETGSWTFTLQASDGNLSQAIERFTLTVREAPPAQLVIETPATELRDAVDLRVEVLDARDLRALRTRITWDPEAFRLVDGSVRGLRPGWAVWSDAAEGRLQIDAAVLGDPARGDARLAGFRLEPIEAPARLRLEVETELISDDGRSEFAERVEGATGALPDQDEDQDEDLEELEGENGDQNDEQNGGQNDGRPEAASGRPDARRAEEER